MRKNVNVVHPVTGRSKRFAKIYVHDGNDIDADAIMAEAKIQFQWDAELSFSTEEFSAAEFDDEESEEEGGDDFIDYIDRGGDKSPATSIAAFDSSGGSLAVSQELRHVVSRFTALLNPRTGRTGTGIMVSLVLNELFLHFIISLHHLPTITLANACVLLRVRVVL